MADGRGGADADVAQLGKMAGYVREAAGIGLNLVKLLGSLKAPGAEVNGAGRPGADGADVGRLLQANIRVARSHEVLTVSAQRAAGALASVAAGHGSQGPGGGKAASGGAGGPGSGAGGSGAGAKNGVPAAPMGPAGRLQQAQQHLQKAQAAGDPTAIFDARYRVHQVQNAMARAKDVMNPPKGLRGLLNAVGNGKIPIGGPGGAIGPVLRGAMQALVPGASGAAGGAAGAVGGAAAGLVGGAAVGGLMIAVAAAGLALKMFADAVMAASESLNSFRAAKYDSGGSTEQIARLGSLGVDPGRVAQAATGFREGALSDPHQRRAARALGAQPRQGPRGQDREVTDLVKALETLRNMGEGEQQTRLARQAKLSSFLPALNVSPSLKKGQDELASLNQSLARPGNLRAAADFQESLQQLGASYASVSSELVSPFLQPLAEMMQNVAMSARMGARYLSVFHEMLEQIPNPLKLATRVPGMLREGLASIVEGIAKGPVGTAFQRLRQSFGNIGIALQPVGTLLERAGKALGQLWMKGLSRLAGPVLDFVASGLNQVAALLEALPAYANGFVAAYNQMSDVVKKMSFGKIDLGKLEAVDLEKARKEVEGQKLRQSQNQLTRAVEENTQIMRAGMYGGGANARASLGQGQRGEFLERAVAGRALRYGAFSL